MDKNIDRASGGGSIHVTPGIAFQEEVSGSETRISNIGQERSKRRSLKLAQHSNMILPKINPKKNPDRFVPCDYSVTPNTKYINTLLTVWKLLRSGSSENNGWPRFIGFVIKLYQTEKKQTAMAYLSPIQTPIAEYPTIVNLFETSRKLAQNANMIYTHIILDVGAAIKAYHVLWNDTDYWNDIIIHLGDFHAMMSFFSIIGTFISGSGFEEIVYQSGLCTSGSINTLLSGKHYNRCWCVHEIISDALERLFIKQYLQDNEELIRNIQNLKGMDDIKETIFNSDVFTFLIEKYQQLKKEGLEGELGKTAQYWLKYTEMVFKLHQFHFAINTNNLPLRIDAWEYFLPLCFATNKIHYARYGTYYIQQLKNLDSRHPGAFEEICEMVSFKGNKTGIGQAVDLAGEQTYMKNAKTAGFLLCF